MPLETTGLDYGDETSIVRFRKGTCFGIAYRIISDEKVIPFIVLETVSFDEHQNIKSEDPSTSVPRAFVAEQIQCLACIVGDPPCVQPGKYLFQVSHDRELLAKRVITVLP
jgi:hypothetical protein